MTIKNILVPLTGLSLSGSSINTALLLAQRFRAHAEILFIKEDFTNYLRLAALDDANFATLELDESFKREQDKNQKLVRQRFDDLLEQHHVDYRKSPLPAEIPSAYWSDIDGSAADEIVQRGAAFDLIVIERPVSDGTSQRQVEAALFETGCSVLIAPPEASKVIGENVMIGWNRSAPAARAVRYAMPFLEMARRVEILAVATGAKRGASPQDIAHYLAWHDVKAAVNSRSPDQRSVGEILLGESKVSGADLLVLGAFSHSRLRETIFGGVTKFVLEHADIPLLMAH